MAKLTTHLADGTEQAYFLKVALGEHGMRMMNGEFESMTVLYAAVPDFVPKPYAWGSYKDIPDTHFFLCEFRSVFMCAAKNGSHCGNSATNGSYHIVTWWKNSLKSKLSPRPSQSSTKVQCLRTENTASRSQHTWAHCLKTTGGVILGKSTSHRACDECSIWREMHRDQARNSTSSRRSFMIKSYLAFSGL